MICGTIHTIAAKLCCEWQVATTEHVMIPDTVGRINVLQARESGNSETAKQPIHHIDQLFHCGWVVLAQRVKA